jgi:hypothetical protein
MAGALVPGPTSPRARSESGIWTDQSPKDSPGTLFSEPTPDGELHPAPSGGRSTPWPARSTGPTSSPIRSGSGTWTARQRRDLVRRRGQPDRGRDRPCPWQDLLDRPRRRHGPGRATWGAAPWAPHKLCLTARRRAGQRSTQQRTRGSWISWQSGLGIQVGNLDGTGTASTLFSGEQNSPFAARVKACEHRASGDLPAEARRGRNSPARTDVGA